MADQEKGSRIANIKAQLGDGSTRIRFFGGLAVCVLAAVVGYFSFRSSTSVSKGEPSQVANVPNVADQHQPDNKGMPQATPAYDNLIAKQNASDAATARATGDSSLPVMRAGVEQKPEPSATAASAPVTQVPQQQSSQDAAASQQYQSELQARQQAITNRVAAMKNQVNLLIASWQPKAHTTMPVRDSGKDVPSTGTVATGSPTTQQQTTSGSSSQAGRTVARAGDVSYAVLDTAVNTDEPGPITATIVQGELKGTKILGKTEVGQNAQKAGLHFTIASMPGQSSSFAIDAWAIDPATARTAMASDVDNHYFLRYGALFASSFLSGFGDALLKGGQSQQLVASPSGNVVQTDAYSTKQLVQIGVANVGKTVGTNMGSVVNRPATITINAGIGIGILFMNDVAVK